MNSLDYFDSILSHFSLLPLREQKKIYETANSLTKSKFDPVNTILLYFQFLERVAPIEGMQTLDFFENWNESGRFIKKNESGFQIFFHRSGAILENYKLPPNPKRLFLFCEHQTKPANKPPRSFRETARHYNHKFA